MQVLVDLYMQTISYRKMYSLGFGSAADAVVVVVLQYFDQYGGVCQHPIISVRIPLSVPGQSLSLIHQLKHCMCGHFTGL